MGPVGELTGLNLATPSSVDQLDAAQRAQYDAAIAMAKLGAEAYGDEAQHVSVSAYGYTSGAESGSTLNVSVATIVAQQQAPEAPEAAGEDAPADE